MQLYWQTAIEKIKTIIKEIIKSKTNIGDDIDIKIVDTSQDHIGDFTILLFPICKKFNLDLPTFASEAAELLQKNLDFISDINLVQGFLNMTLSDFFLVKSLKDFKLNFIQKDKKVILVEFSSPNTNKPLHLGHLRNIFLGQSVVNLMKIAGHKVISTCVVNDRGIHICKSMAAYISRDRKDTPKTTGSKGDFFVGEYYVLFDKIFKEEKKRIVSQGFSEKEAEEKSKIMQLARELLVLWEKNDDDTLSLWKRMNEWVYSGFEETYKNLGVIFDKIYYESKTYNRGKDIIFEGEKKDIFKKKENGSIAVDLEEEKLGEKILLRGDGTSVYITQDLGMAELRNKEWHADKYIYVVGNEQDYHFKVLFKILEKLGKEYAKNMYHLSYGMVELPSGKMKSREGNVIDADDLLKSTFELVKTHSETEVKKSHTLNEDNNALYKKIADGALRYQMLRVDAGKKIVFNPEESVDINGNTGPFIQYTNSRIHSLLKKSENFHQDYSYKFEDINLNEDERKIILSIKIFQESVNMAISLMKPSEIANSLYVLCKSYSRFYSKNTILSASGHSNSLSCKEDKEEFRLFLSGIVSKCIVFGLNGLCIEAPEKM